MKKTVIHEEGIGALINRFESLEEQTIRTFNKIFVNCKLKGFNPNLTVTIGDYDKGRRLVKIGDNLELEYEFSLIDLTLSETDIKPFILRHRSGELIGMFNFINHAIEYLDTNYPAFMVDVANSKYLIEELNYVEELANE